MSLHVIAGLGNPGARYEQTRHNMGFMTLDALADELGISFTKEKWNASLAEGKVGDQKLILVKPLTYMNDSGRALQPILSYYHWQPEEMLLLCDDIDIALGTIRLRKTGSAGTHNGLKSVAREMGSHNFPRIKLAVGRRPARMDLADFVLSRFSEEELPIINEEIEAAVQATMEILHRDMDFAMNRWNGWKASKLPKLSAEESAEARKENKLRKEQDAFRKSAERCGDQ